MELKELSEKTLQIFQAENIFDLGQKLMESLNNEEKMEAFAELVGGDLSTDWLQKIYQYYLADRKDKKRNFRALWIQRINAAARLEGLSYSQLMGALHKAGIEINRKVLADLAINDPKAFSSIVAKVK